MSSLAPFESSIAERYHEETKYTEESLHRDQLKYSPPDWSNPPAPYKKIEGTRTLLPVEGLPIQRIGQDDPGEEVVEGPSTADLTTVSQLLWFTNGCTRVVQHAGGMHHFRAAPSAGAMYPTEVYVAVRDLEGLDDGVYDYQILDHSVVPVREGDVFAGLGMAAFGHPVFESARIVVLLTAEWHRNSWRYRERGYRRALLDTGHVLGNLVECAEAAGLRAVPFGTFQDGPCEEILGIDPVQEGVLAVVPVVTPDAAASAPDMPPRRSPVTEWHKALESLGDRISHQVPEAMIAAVHLAGRIADDASTVAPNGPPPGAAPAGSVRIDVDVPPTAWDGPETVGDTIAARRSTRSFSDVPLERLPLFRALAHAYPKSDIGLFAPELLRTYVVAMNVEGVPPGSYLYEPQTRELVELSRGQAAPAMYRLALGQEILASAAAAIVHIADLTRAVERYGDRAYRLLHLDAGHIGERLNLAIRKEGRGVSGCGGFYDDEMNRVLQIPESQAVVYITSVGTPAS